MLNLALRSFYLQRGWQKAEELFLCSVMVEHIIPTRVCLALMKIYSKAGAICQTAQLLQGFLSQVRFSAVSLLAFALLSTHAAEA